MIGRKCSSSAFACVMCLTTALHADIINVPADQPTIQAGIDAASNGDEVVVAPGTYNEVINFIGKAITLRSSDGVDVTTIDGTGLNSSVVKCVSGEGAGTVLDGFTITNGHGESGIHPDGTVGGGVQILDSSPVITNCHIVANSVTAQGGGLYNAGGDPIVSNCMFFNNQASGGGAIRDGAGNGVITNCIFDGNNALVGGGIVLTSSPTITNCTFTNNSAISFAGAMVLNSDSHPLVVNCIFIDNRADKFAGAYGGGIVCVDGSHPTIVNCTFSLNSALVHGGAIAYRDGGTATLSNCILWENIPDQLDDGGTVT